jgi:molybdopterin molybdotransferase
MILVKEAIDLIVARSKNFGCKQIAIDEAYNCILSEDVCADRDYPPFNRSAMDGYAVVSSDFNNGQIVKLKLTEKLFAGGFSKNKVVSGTCIKIMTGAPVPEGADAVVRVEDTAEKDNVVEFVVTTVKVKQNIALQAEDAKSGDLIISKNTVLDARAIPVLAVLGKAMVNVYNQPKVAIVSTGNEVVSVESIILPHQIRDSNSYSIKNFLKKYAIDDIIVMHIADDKQKLIAEIEKLLDKDILILSGGVSKGDADYVPEVLMSLGVKQIFHRVQIKPGAPLWFGVMPNGGVVFGLPGNPVSVQVAVKIFIEPFIRACFEIERVKPLLLPIFSEKKKKTKLDEYFPCKIVTKNNVTGIVSNRMNGSGDVAATLGSDGIALHPSNVDMVNENTVLEFYPW